MAIKIKRLVQYGACALALGVSFNGYAAPAAASSTAASSAALDSNLKISGLDDNDYFFTENYLGTATLPAFSLAAPTGLVPSWGVIFGSAGGISNSPGTGSSSDKLDGAVAAGIGFGDARESVGGAVTLGIGSISPDGGQLNRGNIGVSFGHFFAETLTGISVGGQNLVGWNSGGGNPDASVYAAITQIISNDFIPVILNAGLGNNGYYFLRSTKAPRTHYVAPFFSATAYILPQLSVIADYTAGVSSVGASIVPIASWPVTVNLGVWDVFAYAPDHDKASFMGSVAYTYQF